MHARWRTQETHNNGQKWERGAEEEGFWSRGTSQTRKRAAFTKTNQLWKKLTKQRTLIEMEGMSLLTDTLKKKSKQKSICFSPFSAVSPQKGKVRVSILAWALALAQPIDEGVAVKHLLVVYSVVELEKLYGSITELVFGLAFRVLVL